MEGVIEIKKFMQHLQDNDLVVIPRKMIEVDRSALRMKLLKQKTASYIEIYEARIWGPISRKRVYQLAVELASDDEIINPKGLKNSHRRIVMSAVIRIAKMRGTYE